MADRAIAWMRTQKAVSPKKPFFMYYAPGTAHAPHHAPEAWIKKFEGKFNHGWDVQREMTFKKMKELRVIPDNTDLPPTPDAYKKWVTLSSTEKKVCAREMECYAAALSHCDHQIGRVINAIEKDGELDNTLIIYIQGDNGATAEDPTGIGCTSEIGVFVNGVVDDPEYMLAHLDDFGGPKMQNHYSHGWAHAMNTPFQWDKKIASHFGGTRNAMVIQWPKRITDKGGLRTQFHHIIDVMPTILEAVGVPAPDEIDGVRQKPVEGISMVYTFDKANEKASSKRTTQYFEIVANRAIYHKGWVAATTPKRLPWVTIGQGTDDPVKDYEWELYNVAEDFTESKNLALDPQHSRQLQELKDLFMAQAEKYQVFPIDDRYGERGLPENRPQFNVGRTKFVYPGHITRITEGMAPDLKNRSYRITADVWVPPGGASGVLMTQGGYMGGYALLLLDGKPVFVHALSNYPQDKENGTVRAAEKLESGKHSVAVDFAYDGGNVGSGGTATITVDGQKVAEKKIPKTIPSRVSLDETLDIGEDCGTPVLDDYEVPYRFTGRLERVVIELEPPKPK